MLKTGIKVLALSAAATATTYFEETFSNGLEGWVEASSNQGKVGASAGQYFADEAENTGLQTQQDAKFYHVSKAFDAAVDNTGKDLVVQFSVKHGQKIDCGGGYIKLLPFGTDLKSVNGDSPYNIMFGPDICGATKKVHVIFNYKGENKLIKKTIPAETDQRTHLYTLIVRTADQTYEVLVDNKKKESGSLEDDWDFLAPKKIKDPAQSKPSDWVDEAQIDDPEDVKPEGYDDIPEEIVDPDAEKPEDWSDEDDGDWEAPTIPNPEYKGPWKAKKIPNPDYKGPWVHPEIENPDYAPDNTLATYTDTGAVTVDVWQVKSGTVFDNILVTDSVEEAAAAAATHYTAFVDAEKTAFDEMKAAEDAKAKAEREAAEAAAAAEEDEDEDEDEDDEDEDEDEPEAKDEL
jgi:calreticulin